MRKHYLKNAIGKGNIEYSYRIFFRKFGGDCKIYKPTLIRLNKAESPEEQRRAAGVSLGNVPSCEKIVKIPRMRDVLNEEGRRLYKYLRKK